MCDGPLHGADSTADGVGALAQPEAVACAEHPVRECRQHDQGSPGESRGVQRSPHVATTAGTPVTIEVLRRTG